jgi:hypothetical protein
MNSKLPVFARKKNEFSSFRSGQVPGRKKVPKRKYSQVFSAELRPPGHYK